MSGDFVAPRDNRGEEIKEALVERAARADSDLRKAYPSFEESRLSEILEAGLRASLPAASEEDVADLLRLARMRGEELRVARGADDVRDHSEQDWTWGISGLSGAEGGSEVEVSLNTDKPNRSRQELVEMLLDKGLAEAEPGYGHATADEVADAVLEWLATWEPR